MPEPLEIITMGRVSVDLYPEQINLPLAKVRTFAKSLGGSPTNVAVAAARFGRRSAVITKVGAEGFGAYVRQALCDFGVDVRFVATDPSLRTPIVFCEIYPPDNFPLLFYRQPKAPDMNISVDELDLAAIRAAPVFWTTGTGLSDEPSRGATLHAMRARSGGHTIHDLDYRPAFWSSKSDARQWAREAIAASSVVIGNLDEVEMATGSRDPHEAGRMLLAMGPALAIVKLGPLGVLGLAGDETIQVPPLDVDVLCGLGAGDAFGGAICHGLLAGWGLSRMLQFANAGGAIVASRLACADAMPDAAEVELLLRTNHAIA